MKEELLIDYIEEASEYLRKRRDKLMELRAEYEEAYGKDVREEMNHVKDEIKTKRNEMIDKIYESADEVRHIKKYFPEFFEVMLNHEEIGRLLKEKEFLFDARQVNPKTAMEEFAQIERSRRQLKDAIKFLEEWQGDITEKQLVATYPALKGKITSIDGRFETFEAVDKIRALDEKLKRDGWKMIVNNEGLLSKVIEKYLLKLKTANADVARTRMDYENVKGQGTTREYSMLKMVKRAEAKKEKIERVIKHLLLSNPAFLSSLKKKTDWLHKGKRSELEKFAETVYAKKITERTWLDEMNKRLKES